MNCGIKKKYNLNNMIDKLETGVEKLLNAEVSDLSNIEFITSIISNIGLFQDLRKSPENPNISMYGNDVNYMMNKPKCGLWQTPIQLSKFVVELRDKNIKTYLDIGTLTGWTITFVAAYLSRFGLEYVDAYDIYPECNLDVQHVWKKYNLPINYIVAPYKKQLGLIKSEYDFIFIDGNHEYNYVRADYDRFKNMTTMLGFHDINDYWCTGVVKVWNEVKNENKSNSIIYEYIDHPNNFRLMGIGCIKILKTL